MNNNQVITIKRDDKQNGVGEIKILEWNVTDPTDSLYAVVTPIKMK
jgi:hypothetical protein